jgi:RNA polymerase sigma-70 factor (ECF subfamily)
VRYVEINGQPGALMLDDEGKLLSVAALDLAGEQVQGVTFIVNPDKLRHIGPVGDLRALLARRDSPDQTEKTEP